jgi:molecular chaperone GrpE
MQGREPAVNDENDPTIRVLEGAEQHDETAPPELDPEAELRQAYEAELANLQEQIRERDHKLREYIEAHQLAVREMDQARARMERDREVELDRHRADLAGSILGVVDDLDRTLDGATRTPNLQAILEGTALVRTQIFHKLEELGVEPLVSLGEIFDPAVHEAVALIPVQDPAQDQQVLAEELPGYLFRGKLLRAARVVVGTLAEG